jgi:dienelactone hydrolase
LIDHPLLLPTSAGPIGAVLTEPDRSPRAAALLLEGVGGRRFGVNQMWTKAARAMASLDVMTMRVDYPGRGESWLVTSSPRRQEAILREVARWFRDRTAGADLILIGVCSGARLALCLTAEDPGISGLGLLVPHLRALPGSRLGAGARRIRSRFRQSPSTLMDRRSERAWRAASTRLRPWVLIGERDLGVDGLSTLAEVTARRGAALELEVVPAIALHRHRSIEAQEETVARLTRWAGRLVTEAVPT